MHERDLESFHMAYCHISLIDLYLDTNFRSTFCGWTDTETQVDLELQDKCHLPQSERLVIQTSTRQN